MLIGVKRVLTLGRVPKDRSSMILREIPRREGLSVQIQYRRSCGSDWAVDRVVYRKCPTDHESALRLAVDLARLGNCESVYVLDADTR